MKIKKVLGIIIVSILFLFYFSSIVLTIGFIKSIIAVMAGLVFWGLMILGIKWIVQGDD